MTVRVVIFDIGGVLFTPARWEDTRARWALRLGLAPERLEERAWYGPDVEAANIGAITAEEYCRRCAQRLGSDPAQVQAMVEELFSGGGLNDDLVDYVRALRGRVRVGALTNTWSFGRELIARRGIGDLFDLVISSAEVGVRKPDRRIYEITCDRLGVAPPEAAFVDDVVENVEAARSVGMHAVLFQSTEQTVAELDALLL